VSVIRLIGYSLCFSLLLQAAFVTASNDEKPRTVRISTGEFAPWSGQLLPHNGHVNHIIQEAFAAQGMQVEFVYLPWKRAYEEARQGKFDATSFWYENTERRDSMLFSDPVIINRTVFFQRADEEEIRWETLSDLSAYRMSATLGFTYTDDFYSAIANQLIAPIMVPSDMQNIKLLMADRIDVFATDEMVGFYIAAQLSIDPRKLKVITPPLNTPTGYLLTTKNNPNAPELIAIFNEGLKKIKAEGIYQQILERADNNSFYNPAVNLHPASAASGFTDSPTNHQ
jgi:polar amino acid transport system substrate-binding protein